MTTRPTSPSSTPTTTSTRPQEALTSTCPTGTAAQSQYVEVRNGRTKIVVRGQISEYIPNPTFDVVARPGAQEEYFRKGNPEGKSRREIFGEPMQVAPGVPRAGAAARADGRAGHRPHADVPDARQPHRGADAGRPRDCIHAVDPRAQRVDVRDLAVQLRGPHLHHAGHHAADRREGDRGARVGRRARRQGRAHPPGAGARLPRPALVRACPSSTRSGSKVVEHDILVAMHSSDSGYERYANEWMGSDSEMLPFQPQAFRMLSSWRPIEDAVAVARLPRRAVPLPDAEDRRRRERQQLGRAAAARR